MRQVLLSLLVLLPVLRADELPIVNNVEPQPLAAQVTRLLDSLDMLGDPLPKQDADNLHRLAASGKGVEEMQRILDKYCLAGVNINPESRVKVQEGAAKPELLEQGWRTFLVKVQNEAGVTAALAAYSPSAGQVANRPEGVAPRLFLDVQMYNKQPMRAHLSGLAVEYRILQIYSRDPGKREAKLIFDVGQGTQDLGFRNEIDILFTAHPANKVTLHVFDSDGQPTTASFLIRDGHGHVYPSQAKRLAPDFFFQPQIYRANGESILLPDGDYTVEYTRGPEYRKQVQKISVKDKPLDLTFRLDRWIDPAKLGYYSGDHHVHAAGCAHYDKPTEGVYPQDMMRHILGEDLEDRVSALLGARMVFPEDVFRRQRQQALDARQPHALRRGGFRLPVQPHGAHCSAGIEAGGLSGHHAHRGLAELGHPRLPLGEIAGRHYRFCAFGLGTWAQGTEACCPMKCPLSMVLARMNISWA